MAGGPAAWAPAARTALLAAAGVALLDLALTFENLWPTLWVRPRLALSLDLAAILLVAALAALRGRLPGPRACRWLAAAFVVAVLGRYCVVMARELYGRPLNLYFDLPHVPRVAAMFAEAAPAWQVAALLAGVVLAIAVLYALALWSVRRIAAALALPGGRGFVAGAAAAVVAAYPLAGRLYADPVSSAYAAQVALVAGALAGRAEALAASPAFSARMDALDGADVLVVFVESYGAATYDDGTLAARVAPARESLRQAAADGGFGSVSAFVAAPTFGGASWLAHASLLAGVEVRSGGAYNLLLTQRRDTLVGAFAAQGYRTVALMPGLRQPWHDGERFYGFDAIAGAAELDYRGPAFGWWRIPDQFALARLDAALAARDRPPLFVFFPTISSHAPFRPVPPYQPDWARLASAVPFDPAFVASLALEGGDWRDLPPAYAQAIGYTLESIAGFLRRARDRELVVVVLGDHQPPAGVAGERPSWDVPVHVFARRGALLARLVEGGFAPGLVPPRPAIGRTHDLTPLLLDAFAGAAPLPDPACEDNVTRGAHPSSGFAVPCR